MSTMTVKGSKAPIPHLNIVFLSFNGKVARRIFSENSDPKPEGVIGDSVLLLKQCEAEDGRTSLKKKKWVLTSHSEGLISMRDHSPGISSVLPAVRSSVSWHNV